MERKKHASLTEITEMIASSGICKDSLATDEVQSLVQMLVWDGDLDEVAQDAMEFGQRTITKYKIAQV